MTSSALQAVSSACRPSWSCDTSVLRRGVESQTLECPRHQSLYTACVEAGALLSQKSTDTHLQSASLWPTGRAGKLHCLLRHSIGSPSTTLLWAVTNMDAHLLQIVIGCHEVEPPPLHTWSLHTYEMPRPGLRDTHTVITTEVQVRSVLA